MKIAMIGQKGAPATYGGIERHVEELSRRLAARGHEVTIYCRRHYTPANSALPGVTLRILPSIHTLRLDTISHTALALADAARRGFDLIHFHAIGPSLLSFLPRALPGRRAVVATVHALDWQRRKWGPVARWWLRRGEWAAVTFPHRTIVVSRLMEERFRARGKGVVYIPNGVPEPQPTPLSELARYGIVEPGFILWMGRFVPEKRVEDLIAAFRQLPAERQLVLAGEMEDSPYCRRLRALASGEKRILFPGGLYGAAKNAALSHAGAFVLPSEMEGFPIALLEAMRYGLPVLASDIPENLEALTPGVSGFAFKRGDVESLRGQLEWMLSHLVEAQSAGARAREEAARYDWDRITLQTEQVYDEAKAVANK